MSVLCVGLVFGAAGSGCHEESESPTAAAPARLSPEQSFAEIVKIVSRSLDTGSTGVPSGFVSNDAGSRSQFVVRNEVTSQLIPPKDAGENYRGTITVASRSVYTFRRPQGTPNEEPAGEQDSQDDGGEFSLLEDTDPSDGGFGEANDGLVSAAPEEQPESHAAAGGDRVDFRRDEDVSVFELTYENGRWVLKTEPDAKTEQSIKKAFDYALSLQR